MDSGLSPTLCVDLVNATLPAISLSVLLHGVSATPLMAHYQRRRAGRSAASPPRRPDGAAGGGVTGGLDATVREIRIVDRCRRHLHARARAALGRPPPSPSHVCTASGLAAGLAAKRAAWTWLTRVNAA